MLSIIALVIVCLANVLLASVVLLNNPKATLNRVFCALLLIIPVWSIVVFLEDAPSARNIVEFLARLDYVLAACMLGLFYWFCTTLAKVRSTVVDITVGALTFVSLAFSTLGLTTTVTISGSNIVLQPDIGFLLFVVLLVTAVPAGLLSLFKKYEISSGRERAKISLVSLGLLLTVIGLVFAVVVVPRVLGVANADVTRAGISSTLIFASFSAYAVVRRRFMDVRLLVTRSVAYVLLLLTLALSYTVIAFQIGGSIFGTEVTTTREIYNLLLMFAIAFTFQPLRSLFEKLTNHLFYREHYDPQAVLNAFSKILTSGLDIDYLLKQSVEHLCRELHLEYGKLVLVKDHRMFREGHYGTLPRALADSPDLGELRGETMLVADELEEGDQKQLLDRLKVSIFLALKTQNETVGYLLLGHKLSGGIYATQDVKLLEIVAKELAVAMQNAMRFEEIQKFNITLQEEVDRATKQLRRSNERLRLLDRTKDDFISMASHQLRTPLTSVKGYLSMTLEGDVGAVSQKQRKLLSQAFISSQRMVYLIADMLNVSRLKTGKFVIEPEPTDLADAVQTEIEQLLGTAAARGLKLTYKKPANFPVLMLDQTKIRQVIMNFVDNAIYYTPSGGRINVALKDTGKALEFTVTDNGIGVPKREQHHLFNKFYRAGNAKKARPDGTGLGLYMAKKVIIAQGGSLIFHSAEGKGSTFGFTISKSKLPQVDEAKAPADSAGETDTKASPEKKPETV